MKRVALVFIILFSFLYVRLNMLNNKKLEVSNFSSYEIAEIYTLGAIMSIVAYPFFPEAERWSGHIDSSQFGLDKPRYNEIKAPVRKEEVEKAASALYNKFITERFNRD